MSIVLYTTYIIPPQKSLVIRYILVEYSLIITDSITYLHPILSLRQTVMARIELTR